MDMRNQPMKGVVAMVNKVEEVVVGINVEG